MGYMSRSCVVPIMEACVSWINEVTTIFVPPRHALSKDNGR